MKWIFSKILYFTNDMEAKPLTNHYIPEIPLFKVAEIKVFFQLLQKLQQLNRCILCNSSPVHHFREVTEMVFIVVLMNTSLLPGL